MEFKDYYAALGVARGASHDEIKRAYRKLARKYHPDVSKLPDAEARFKEVAEAHEALIDPERRAAYDDIAQRHANGQPFDPPPGWDSGFEFSGRGPKAAPGGARGRRQHDDEGAFSDFFASMFGRGGAPDASGRRWPGDAAAAAPGNDHHAKLAVSLLDTYRGGPHRFSLRMAGPDAAGRSTLQERQLEVNIPRGIRAGQKLRLAGQGGAGAAGAAAGDLYLEIELLPHPVFRVDGADISFDLPVAPWEAALGATVTADTPDGSVQLTVPAASTQGRRLRLRGKGLPGAQPGDLYAVLTLALPPASPGPGHDAYTAFALAFAGFNPRERQAPEGAAANRS